MNLWIPLSLIVIAALVASNLWLIYRVLYPIRRLAAQTANLARGEVSAFQETCGGIKEIGILSHSMASMARHVGRAQEQDLTYRNALTNGQEAERARIARELHDDTVQSLIAIAQSIDLATAWLEKEPARALSTLKLARTHAVETVENLRRTIANLRPPALEELGLVPALRMLAENSEGFSVVVHVEGPERRLQEAQELALFRSAQEAVRNAQKHSQAQQVTINVCYQPTDVTLTIVDNGVGFPMPERLEALAEAGHYGMVGIAERAQSLDGDFKIKSAPKQGTQLHITIPVSSSNQPLETVRDPVCGAIIKPQQAYGSLVYEGERLYFCCPVCQGAFQRGPETYIEPKS
jgi:signal transduction histidine kinase/YHS domain-containing protein